MASDGIVTVLSNTVADQGHLNNCNKYKNHIFYLQFPKLNV
jgi:hypothetical protein